MRGRFDGGAITSDVGGLLLCEVEKRTGIIAPFAACFGDQGDPARVLQESEYPTRESFGRGRGGPSLAQGASEGG